jgi:uncharacterized membrane protein
MGWIVECIACSINQKKLVHDRGFLIGPYCPIYGYGAMYMYFFLSRYYHEPITLFVMAVVGTSTLEFMTSYLMEKIFKARWWDYSQVRFNLEGRICLRNSALFGILGLAFIYLVNPLFLYFIEKIPKMVLMVITIILLVTFLIDNILTFIIMSDLKNKLTNIRKDSTSDIDKEVREILSRNTFYIKKLLKAFPKAKFSFPVGEQILSSIRKTLDNVDELRKERKRKVKELKKELKKKKKESSK